MADPRRATFLLSAAALLVAALASPAAPQSPPARTQTLTVTVTDRNGSLIRGLKPENFTVVDGKLQLPLSSFSAADQPASIGLLLDTSGSMFAERQERLRLVCKAIADFLDAGNPANDYFFVAFNQQPQIFLEPRAGREAVVGVLEKLAAAKHRGQTALYDALYLAVDKAAYGRHPKRVLLLISDGQDSTSEYDLRAVRRALAESDVLLYAVAIVEEQRMMDNTPRVILEELTRMTGGRSFYVGSVQELQAALANVAVELRNQYALAFVPAASARKDGWHDLKVKLAGLRDARNRKVELRARTRPGFYEPPGRR